MSPFDLALLFRTIWIACTIGVLATILAIPAAWALRRLRPALCALLLAPMLVPSHLVYASWGLLRAPGTSLGDRLAELGSDPDRGPDVWNAVTLTHAVLALSLWAWPLAALILSVWTRPIEREALDAMRTAGARAHTIGVHVVRVIAPGLAVSVLLIGALMIGSPIPLHLARQETYALVIWTELAQGHRAEAWWASWPLLGVALVAGAALAVALMRGFDPAVWRGAGRDTAVRARWLIGAGLVWCIATLVPMGLVVATIDDWARAGDFWRATGDRVLASGQTALGVAILCAFIAVLCGAGFATGAPRPFRWAAAVTLGALAITFFVPGVLIGGAIASIGATADSIGGLILAHVARFGLIAAIAGLLVARTESRALRDARIGLGGGAQGWIRGVALGQAGVIVGAAGAIALLSMHEIESAVLLARAGHATLSQYMLDLLHYFRMDELLSALLWAQGIGLAAAVGAALATSRGARRLVRDAGMVTPVLLVLVLIGGCTDDAAPADGTSIKVVRSFGETGRGPGQLVFPRAVATDGQSLWVIDKTARVQRFGLKGEIGPAWRMPRYDRGRPCGITCGHDGLIYVADTHEHRIAIYRPTENGGELVRTIGVYGMGPGQFIYPTDVAIDHGPDGVMPSRFYVSEYGGNDRISVFDGNWNFLREVASGDAHGFARPQSIAFDEARDELVVVDASHHRVGVFTRDGVLVRWIGDTDDHGPTFGDEPGAFSQPFGLALLGDGSALVTEVGTQRVQNIDLETGACLGVFGQGGWGEDELIQPWAVAVIGRLAFVLDSGKDRIVAFRHGRTPPSIPVALARKPLIGEDTAR